MAEKRGRKIVQQIGRDQTGGPIFFGSKVSGKSVQMGSEDGGVPTRVTLPHESRHNPRQDIANAPVAIPGLPVVLKISWHPSVTIVW